MNIHNLSGTPSKPIPQPKLYSYLGCWMDSSSSRAIPSLEGTDLRLRGTYSSRDYAIYLCYQVAKSRGFHVFALQYSGMCMGMRGSMRYQKYGKATTCKDGEGARYANDVYRIGGKNLDSDYLFLIFHPLKKGCIRRITSSLLWERRGNEAYS